MAKEEAPKPKWYSAIFQAFKFVRLYDKTFLPVFIVMVVLILGGGIVVGFLMGTTVGHVYANISGVLLTLLGTLILLTARVDKAAFNRFEHMPGGSLAALQMIRRGWKFEDEPIAVDGKGKAVVFMGVGKGGIVLVAEGGNAAHKTVVTTRKRIQKSVPGVPIHEIFMGDAPNQVNIRKLGKTVKRLKKILSKKERAVIEARLHALGGTRLPVPKGVDPMRARPNRKAMRG